MLAAQIPGWRDACDTVVDEKLERVGLKNPPVDAFDVAKSLGVEVVLSEHLLRRTRWRRTDCQSTIFLKPDKNTARMHWQIAHELGEMLVPEVVLATGHQTPIGGLLREQIANELAGRMLLPRRWFFEAMEREDFDLLMLKEQFSTASFELILLGMLRWPQWSMVSIFHENEAPRRFCNQGKVQAPTTLEFDVWDECRRSGRPCDLSEDGVRVQAWPIHDETSKRELIRTTEADCSVEVQQELFEYAL